MVEMWQKYYIGPLLHVVVLGAEPLDTLQVRPSYRMCHVRSAGRLFLNRRFPSAAFPGDIPSPLLGKPLNLDQIQS